MGLRVEKFSKIFFLLAGLTMLSEGCVIYSMKAYPPQEQISATYEPFDVSIALGSVNVYRGLSQIPIDEDARERIEQNFQQEVTKLKIVREVVPRGQKADIYYDDDGRPERSVTSSEKSFYKGIAFLFALFLPIPYPYDFTVDHTIRLRANVEGASYVIREYHIRYTLSLWGVSLWAPAFSKDNLQKNVNDYLVPRIANKILGELEFFKNYERAVKSGDAQQIKKLLSVARS